MHGNSPIMLAGIFSHTDSEYLKVVRLLMDSGANILIKDSHGWTISDEARANHNVGLFSMIFDKHLQQRKKIFYRNRPFIMEKLSQCPDFYVEIKWHLHSSVIPLVQKFLPSDTYYIWKYGMNVRLDFQFVGMNGMK